MTLDLLSTITKIREFDNKRQSETYERRKEINYLAHEVARELLSGQPLPVYDNAQTMMNIEGFPVALADALVRQQEMILNHRSDVSDSIEKDGGENGPKAAEMLRQMNTRSCPVLWFNMREPTDVERALLMAQGNGSIVPIEPVERGIDEGGRDGRVNITTIDELDWELHSEIFGVERAVVRFKNGYSASVLRGGEFPYTKDGTYEIAVLRNGEIDYTTPITDDVLGYLSEEAANKALIDIADLPDLDGSSEGKSKPVVILRTEQEVNQYRDMFPGARVISVSGSLSRAFQGWTSDEIYIDTSAVTSRVLRYARQRQETFENPKLQVLGFGMIAGIFSKN